MGTINYLPLKKDDWIQQLPLLLLVLLLTSCNVSGNRGAVWLGDPVITTKLDKTGEPIDSAATLPNDTTIVYCYLSIKGPEGVKLFVRWYHEEQMVVEQFIDFGKERKAAPLLNFHNDEPLPPGNYRCEYGIEKDKPLRVINFSVLEFDSPLPTLTN